MPFRFIDGFANYNTLADLQTKWAAEATSIASTYGTGFTFETGADRRKSFGASLGIASGSGLNFHTDAVFVRQAMFSLAVSRDAATTRTFLSAGNAGNQSFRLTWDADGSFELFDQANTSQGKSSTFANNTHTYNFVTLLVPITNPATVKLYLNGVLQKTWTGVNTSPGGAGTFTTDYFIGATTAGASTGAKLFISDVVLESPTLTATPTPVANYEIETIFPTGTGDSFAWTNSGGTSIANYSYVDENPPDATDFLTCGFASQDLYTFPASRGTTNIWPQASGYVKYDATKTLVDQSVDAYYKHAGTTTFWGAFAAFRNLPTTYELRTTMQDSGSMNADGTTATQWGPMGNHAGSSARPSNIAAFSVEWLTLGVVAGATGPVIGTMGMGLVGGRLANG